MAPSPSDMAPSPSDMAPSPSDDNDVQRLLRVDNILDRGLAINHASDYLAYTRSIRLSAAASHRRQLALAAAMGSSIDPGTSFIHVGFEVYRGYPKANIDIPRISKVYGVGFKMHTQLMSQATLNNLYSEINDDNTCAYPTSGKSAKSAGTKKLKDPPRRPLRDYDLYFREERRRLLATIPSDSANTDSKQPAVRRRGPPKPEITSEKSNAHARISPDSLSKIIDGRWRTLPRETRAKYKILSDEDHARYEFEIKEYNREKETMAEEETKMLEEKTDEDGTQDINDDEVEKKESQLTPLKRNMDNEEVEEVAEGFSEAALHITNGSSAPLTNKLSTTKRAKINENYVSRSKYLKNECQEMEDINISERGSKPKNTEFSHIIENDNNTVCTKEVNRVHVTRRLDKTPDNLTPAMIKSTDQDKNTPKGKKKLEPIPSFVTNSSSARCTSRRYVNAPLQHQ